MYDLHYYVRYEGESFEEAIKAHNGYPFPTVQEVFAFLNVAGEEGRKFQIFDQDHRIVQEGEIST